MRGVRLFVDAQRLSDGLFVIVRLSRPLTGQNTHTSFICLTHTPELSIYSHAPPSVSPSVFGFTFSGKRNTDSTLQCSTVTAAGPNVYSSTAESSPK